MGLQRLAVELLDQPTAVDDPDPGRESIDLGQDVARHEDGHAALPGEVTDQLADLDDPGRVEAVRRLVEHEQLGLVEQRPREREPLQVAERERARASVGVLLEREPLDHPVDDACWSATPARRRATSRFSRTVSSG